MAKIRVRVNVGDVKRRLEKPTVNCVPPMREVFTVMLDREAWKRPIQMAPLFKEVKNLSQLPRREFLPIKARGVRRAKASGSMNEEVKIEVKNPLYLYRRFVS